MSRRMTIIGLAALCALALSAVAASGASAGTTAFTCVSGGTAGPSKFSDADCTTVLSTGGFGHTAIPVNTSTTLKLNKLTNPVLEGKLFGANVKLEGTGVECVGCSAENKEVGGVMEVTGTGGTLTFTGVKVVGLEEKCEVVGTKAEDITTQPLKFTTTVSTGATLEPVSGTLLAQFNIKAKTGKECSVAGENLKVTGKSAATLKGAKLTVNVTKESGELKLEGEKASLKGEGTIESSVPASGVFHPVALTTTTP